MKAIQWMLCSAGLATALIAPWDIPTFPRYPGDVPLRVARLPMSGVRRQMTPLQVTSNVAPLIRTIAPSRSSLIVQTIRAQVAAGPAGLNGTTHNATMMNLDSGSIYTAPVTVGGQAFQVILDTGSSDPWLITPNLTCINLNDDSPQDPSLCLFGPTYNSSQSGTFHAIGGENINVSYTDGEFLSGSMGYESFTMAGVTVAHQEFGLVNYAGWSGDGVSSGVIGFAYSTLTSAHAGTNPGNDTKANLLTYNTLFNNMWNLSLIPPVFTLALDRNSTSGGLVALGGIPDVPHTPVWISTPIQSVGVFPNTTTPAYEYYTINIDGFALSVGDGAQFGPANGTNPIDTPLLPANTTVLVDSGTSLLYAPDNIAVAFIQAFDPPGYVDPVSGYWAVACNGTPPTFGVSIGQKIFYIDPVDLVNPSATGGNVCLSGVQNATSSGGLTILGDVWMKNVLVVHDIGAEMMRFAAREYYGLTPDPVVPP